LGLIGNDRENWRSAERSAVERASYTLGATIASGATTIRSHAQVDSDSGLERLEAVLGARQEHADRATVQVVAFPQAGIVRDRGTAALLDAALTAGADLIGGLDPCGIDRDPAEHLDIIFGLAERHGVGLDIHLHEAGLLGAFSLEMIFERVRALGMQGQVTISHAFALATNSDDVVAALIDSIAELRIALTTIAPSGTRVLPHEKLQAAGVRVGLGQDGIRDYWSPFGDGDMLGRTWQLAFVRGLRRDDLIEGCVEIATLGGRSVVDRELPADSDAARGLGPGDPADLVLVAGETVTAAVMDRSASRLVIHQGRLVARDLTLIDRDDDGLHQEPSTGRSEA